MNNELPFKVKGIYIDLDCLTVGKEYDVVEVDDGFYKVKNDSGEFKWYYNNRFEIVETPPKDKQEFSIGDKVIVNKISDDYVSHADKHVKVGDIATVVEVKDGGNYNLCITNPNWIHGWWFYKTDVSFVDSRLDYHLLSYQEVIQAILDGKDVEIQYTDGTWNAVITKVQAIPTYLVRITT